MRHWLTLDYGSIPYISTNADKDNGQRKEQWITSLTAAPAVALIQKSPAITVEATSELVTAVLAVLLSLMESWKDSPRHE